jgi:hypothetical protein
VAFQDDLGLGRHLQRHGLAVHQLDLLAAQQAGELVLRQRVGHRRHGGQDGAGVGADHHGGGEGLGLARRLPARVVLRAAAVLQPAHQRGVLARHLHAVDAEVEVVLLRCPSAPCVTTSGQVISGAGSPGQQVWIGSRPRSISSPVSTISCTGAVFTVFGRIDMTVLQPAAGISMASRQPPRRLRLAQEGQQSRRLRAAGGGGAVHGHAHGHALRPCRTG